jgi:predicted Fe-S protein YdhL (DUF1289 family)
MQTKAKGSNKCKIALTGMSLRAIIYGWEIGNQIPDIIKRQAGNRQINYPDFKTPAGRSALIVREQGGLPLLFDYPSQTHQIMSPSSCYINGACLPVSKQTTANHQSGAPVSTIPSPCILVCSIDMKSGFCFGCGRTRDEIAGWMGYSDNERTGIMQQLAERLESVERKPRRETRRQRIARDRGETHVRLTDLEGN